jgi:hypothetical protein
LDAVYPLRNISTYTVGLSDWVVTPPVERCRYQDGNHLQEPIMFRESEQEQTDWESISLVLFGISI